MAEQTREYRIGHTESIYLTRFGQIGMRAYFEVASGRKPASDLENKLRAHVPATDDDALGLRFALLGIEMARRSKGAAGNITAETAATVRAMKALEDETLDRPAPATAPAQPDTCRHGVSYAAVCAACDEE